MLVRESINFQKGLTPKESLNLGWDIKIKRFLDWIANDYQFNFNDENFLGFLSVSEDSIMDKEMLISYRYFVDHWRDYKDYMDSIGIYLEEPPDYDESVFAQLDNHKWHPSKINEEFIMKFQGRWQKPGEEVEIYKNPASLKRMGKWNRAISDKWGNIFVSDVSETTHNEIFKKLYSIGKIHFNYYHDKSDEILEMCGWQRYSNSKNFYLAESFDPLDIKELGDQINKFADAAKERNPQYNFTGDMIISDVYK